MKASYIMLNILFAFGLFFLNALLGRIQYGLSGKLFQYGKFTFADAEQQNFSGNFFQKIVNPAVYLAVIAAVMQTYLPAEFIRSLLLGVPLFWIIRLGYMAVKNVILFLNWPYELTAAGLSLVLGEGILWGIIVPLMEDNEGIWIPATALRDALWFAILAYLAKVVWDILRQKFTLENLYPAQRRKEYIWKRYSVFNRKYGEDILDAVTKQYDGILTDSQKSELICTVYAIMIYENYNRSWLFRMGENLLKATIWRHRVMSLGIMQVRTSWRINDQESISLAIEKIGRPFLEGGCEPVRQAIQAYNHGPDYEDEVMAIFSELSCMVDYDTQITMDNKSCKR